MFNYQGSSPTLQEVVFEHNTSGRGAGMHNHTSSNPQLTDVVFQNNSAEYWGGGVYNYYSSPRFERVTFEHNTAQSGAGGLNNNNANPILLNVTLDSNTTPGLGGGIANYASNPILTNVTLTRNSADGQGGGMYSWNGSQPTLINTLIAQSTGGDCVNDGTSLNANSHNNLIEDDTHACGLTDGANGNIVGHPAQVGALGDYGGQTKTVPLLPGSPAIDTGDDAACPATDQRGVARPQGSHCDIGAYERDEPR